MNIDKITTKIIGKPTQNSLQSELIIASLIVGIVCGVISLMTNILIGLGTTISLLSVLIILMCCVLYYISRFKNKHILSSYIVAILLSFFIYPFLWIENGGSSSGIIYFYIFNVVFFAIVFKKRVAVFIIFLQIIMINLLYFFEYLNPQMIKPYPSIEAKLIDQVVSYLIVSTFLYIITRWVMHVYNDKIFELNATHKELNTALKKLELLSSIDELSQINNRRSTFELLKADLKEADGRECISILMLDIDYFKKINDTYGHSAGDEVIKKVAQLLQNKIRKTDFVGRIGGEEFLVVFPDTSLEDAKNKSNDLQVEISNIEWEQKELSVTLSGGLFSFKYLENISIEKAIEQADKNLYKAKENGRNCIIS